MISRRTITILLAAVLVASATAPIAGVGAASSASPAVNQEDAQAANETKRADLTIYQPHYVERGVQKDDGGEHVVYQTAGRELQIQPENFDPEDVADVSIKEDVGTIRYDRDRNIYIFDSEGMEASFTITWEVHEDVNETVVEDNVSTTKTRTVERQYSAVISTDDVDLAHIPNSRLESIRSDAENWSETSDLYGSVGSSKKSIEAKLQLGAHAVDALHNPGKALKGDFGMAIQTVFFSVGGLIFFTLWNIPHLVRSRRLRKENKELKEKIGDYEEIDDALDELFTEKRRRYLKEKSWNQWFDDRTAYWLRRNFSPDPHAGSRRLLAMLSPAHLNSIVAGGMLDTGRFATVVDLDPDDAYSDGGEPVDVVDVERDVLSARMVDVESLDDQDVDENQRVITDPAKLDHDIAEKIDPGTLRSDILRREDVDLRDVALPVANQVADDDLVAKMNVSIPEDFRTREHFAEVLETIITKVAASDYTTDEGEIQPERDLANFLAGFASIFGESYDQPYFRFVRDLMLFNLDRLDASERTQDVVDEVRDLKDQGAGS